MTRSRRLRASAFEGRRSDQKSKGRSQFGFLELLTDCGRYYGIRVTVFRISSHCIIPWRRVLFTRDSIGIVRSSDQPFTMFLLHYPSEDPFPRVARSSVKISIAGHAPINVYQCNCRR